MNPSYPDVRKGTKKLLTSQILSIVNMGCSLCSLVLTFLVFGSIAIEMDASMDHITEMFFVAGQLIMLAVLMLVSTVLALVILIFELVGLSSCKKEQIYFRSAFTACLISVPFTILRLPVFGTYAVVLFGYFEGFFHTFSYCAMIYAYGRIAEERGEIGLKRKGTFLIRLIVTVKLLNMLMGSVSQFFGTTLGNAVIIPLALVIGVLTVGQCFLIFGFLRRAGRMLDGFV